MYGKELINEIEELKDIGKWFYDIIHIRMCSDWFRWLKLSAQDEFKLTCRKAEKDFRNNFGIKYDE